MIKSIKVSVLTPSFNQGAWLNDNLKSVRNQTHGSIEHIVMDGGSSDDTVGILETSGPSVVWQSESDRGQSHALNKALTASSGDIVGWLNSDDAYVDRRAVEHAVAVFDSHPEVGVVYGHGLLVSQSNRVMQFIWSPPMADRLLRLQTFFVQPSVFIRRSLLADWRVNEDLHYVMDSPLSIPARFGLVGLALYAWTLLSILQFQRRIANQNDESRIVSNAIVGFIEIVLVHSFISSPVDDKGFSFALAILLTFGMLARLSQGKGIH